MPDVELKERVAGLAVSQAQAGTRMELDVALVNDADGADLPLLNGPGFLPRAF